MKTLTKKYITVLICTIWLALASGVALADIDETAYWPVEVTISWNAVYGTVTGISLDEGDSVGMFNKDGKCFGAGIYNGTHYFLSAFAREEEDPDKTGDFTIDGFEEGDEVIFKVYKESTGEELVVKPSSGQPYIYEYKGAYPPNRIDLVYAPDDAGTPPPDGGGNDGGAGSGSGDGGGGGSGGGGGTTPPSTGGGGSPGSGGGGTTPPTGGGEPEEKKASREPFYDEDEEDEELSHYERRYITADEDEGLKLAETPYIKPAPVKKEAHKEKPKKPFMEGPIIPISIFLILLILFLTMTKLILKSREKRQKDENETRSEEKSDNDTDHDEEIEI